MMQDMKGSTESYYIEFTVSFLIVKIKKELVTLYFLCASNKALVVPKIKNTCA